MNASLYVVTVGYLLLKFFDIWRCSTQLTKLDTLLEKASNKVDLDELISIHIKTKKILNRHKLIVYVYSLLVLLLILPSWFN